MTFRKNFAEFINEQRLNEDHLKGRQSWYDYIYTNGPKVGYDELADMEQLVSMTDMALRNFYNMIEELLDDEEDDNDSLEESMFISEAESHDGWLVIGFDKGSKKAEILSIPLLKKEAIRFLQNFEVQMSKMSDSMKKYTKLKLAHASEVFESIQLEGETYSVNEELYDFVRDIKSAIGSRHSVSSVEDYLGRTLSYEEQRALKRAGVIR